MGGIKKVGKNPNPEYLGLGHSPPQSCDPHTSFLAALIGEHWLKWDLLYYPLQRKSSCASSGRALERYFYFGQTC